MTVLSGKRGENSRKRKKELIYKGRVRNRQVLGKNCDPWASLPPLPAGNPPAGTLPVAIRAPVSAWPTPSQQLSS